MGLKINQLPTASSINNTGDYFPVSQNNITKRIDIRTLTDNVLVSKEDYNNTVNELNNMKSELENIKDSYHEIKNELDKNKEDKYESINSNDFIDFNGEELNIENSKLGFTKDTIIEGKSIDNFMIQKTDSVITLNSQKKKIFYELKYTKSNTPLILTFNIEGANISKFTIKMSIFINGGNAQKEYEITEFPSKGIFSFKITNNNIFKGIGIVIEDEEFNTNPDASISFSEIRIFEGEKDYGYFYGVKSVGESESNVIKTFSTNKQENENLKIHEKEYIIPFDKGLKGFKNGIKDTIEKRKDGLYFIKRIEEKILSIDDEVIYVPDKKANNTKQFNVTVLGKKGSTENNALCPTFEINNNIVGEEGSKEGKEGIAVQFENTIVLRLASHKIYPSNVEGYRKWLQENDTTIYYELTTPIEYKIKNYATSNLETYEDTTYISSRNNIKPNFKLKAPIIKQ